MALNAYLNLKGQKTGQIKGSVTQKGRENTIEVSAFNHEIVSPRDSASGLPTGKRMHKPFVITKELDKSTPLLYTALVTNEKLTQFELKCFAPSVGGRIGGVGVETNHFTIKLTNANIVSIRSVMSNNNISDLATLPVMEEITFTYQKIEWTWVDGGITAQDDWESPVV
jgi:type VI secretion system secreted protein Hcp